MSGTFERQMYDEGAYQAAIRQATARIHRTLDPIAVTRCNPCRVPNPGFIGSVGVSVTGQRPLIDVESDLMRLGRHNTKDLSEMYRPVCPQCGKCNEGLPCGGGVVRGCQNCQEKLNHLPRCEFDTDYTRLSNPICTSREVGINRFQPLCLNPQDENRWLQPSEIGISYRLVVKDNHVPCVPKMIDPTPLLPTGKGPLPCPKIDTEVCGVYTKPMHKHGMVNRQWN